jgi:hypothetical protein
MAIMSIHRSSLLPAIAAALAASLSAPASAAFLYSDDFDAPPVLAPGVAASGFTNGALETANPFGAWSGQYFANRSLGNPASPSVLTLSNLPAHSSIKVEFTLGFLESWDSDDGFCCTPDFLQIKADNALLLDQLTTNNFFGTRKNFGGGITLAEYVQANQNNFSVDTLVDMAPSAALIFPHSANTLALSLGAYGDGWQGDTDEAWGIDSLRITYEPVPGPLPLLGAASAFGLSRQLRRRVALAKNAKP